MFYSETLLAKNGALARVWLASNMEKKLSKQNILSEHIDTKVKDIIGTGQAPIALRLSGQLLLGVVRIYSRKARYLLDDCNEALSKIKMAFRPGNVDLPSNTTHVANANQLILPDTITELDLFAPLPDPAELLREPEARGPGRDPTLLDFGHSQLLPESQTPSRREEKRHFLDDDDLGLDLGLDPGEEAARSTPADVERSIEIGRRAATPRRDDPSMLMDDDLGLDMGFDVTDHDTIVRPAPKDNDISMLNADDDLPLVDMDDIAAANAAAFSRLEDDAERRQRQRDSISPLSTVRASLEPELERTFHLDQAAMQGEQEQEEDETVVQARAQRVKRRKVMRQDTETELHNSQIKAQQADRSGITKAPEFLPRDPLLLQLMEMRRTGGFVSSIMGDGRMQGWAPELRGILSVEVVRKAGEKKRKRDSGIADVETGSERLEASPPRLEIPQDEEDEGFQAGAGAMAGDFDVTGADPTLHSDGAAPPMSDGMQPQLDDNDDQEQYAANSPAHPFDITEAPLLHPSQTGPVSLGTKNAVHLLREHFAPGHASNSFMPPTPSKRTKAEALFTDLCPVETTSVEDATKMFFELLVLGTKDAVKVEQDPKDGLGGPIRVRGKRGLWGDWAERNAGGEIAIQEEAEG
ncbi:sister chromatid cohesion protein 1 [Friedmanniomyces endolithicus]|nr:sister chromatid cohesion protein 1 [Friedmanniomyces endolithicus]KAK0799517.1 sister chromatid cohesion protein 1 [Friedmanniomyces endolithicus]KAK0800753.1 sister chromatid cohesion protein 1 [Friedmanniomyces endolithicus]KAK0815823.1 sister chromatid cohesion protein 1 [Friedmanniomyces endolithicus]KAK0849833.1 sister chromatid cohesion protein 1 [Friedmanniomyces endolithicus]